jgi:hypothetical protein
MYMVEHLFTYGWDDADWHDENGLPWRFDTFDAAWSEVREFVQACPDYRLHEFRVVVAKLGESR